MSLNLRICELFNKVDAFGSMHIVVGDGNLEDDHLDFVADVMSKHLPIADEIELLSLLRATDVETRYELWERAIYGAVTD